MKGWLLQRRTLLPFAANLVTHDCLGRRSPIHSVGPKKMMTPATTDASLERSRSSAAFKEKVHHRDGYNCRFCGMPVVRSQTRKRMRDAYSAAINWGDKEIHQHAAFQAMWAQYDHIVPHSRGGTNDLDNLVLTCAPCNFGRAGYSLHEVGVSDPRSRLPMQYQWDGLERFHQIGPIATIAAPKASGLNPLLS